MGYYKPATFDLIKKIVKSEKNPEIRAIAIRGLGKFRDKAAQKLIISQLDQPSFRNVICSAAIDAARSQRDPKLVKPIMRAISERATDFSGRGLSSVLRTVAQLASEAKKPSPQVRKFLESYLADPRPSVQRGAINALGELGDSTAVAMLEAFQNAGPEDTRKAAASAIRRLQEVKPVAAREILELRKELTDLRKKNDDFAKQLETLKKQLEASLDKPATKDANEKSGEAAATEGTEKARG